MSGSVWVERRENEEKKKRGNREMSSQLGVGVGCE